MNQTTQQYHLGSYNHSCFPGKDKNPPHLWVQKFVFITILVVWVIILNSCGLPDYSLLEKPIVLLGIEPQTIIGFTTPADDTGISGYTLYYKIYSSYQDYDEAYELPSGVFVDDAWFFDEGNYVNTTDELQPGSTVPLNRGFVLAGYLGDSILPNSRYTIVHTGPGDDIYIDFNANIAIDPNLRDEPIVGLGPLPIASTLYTLARGYIDPNTYSSDKLRRFVDDWYFSISPDDFHDGDLRRPPGKQPGTELSDITGTPILSSDTSHDRLIIGFVTHSVGYDVSTLSPLDSKPVFLGKIEYTDIQRNNDRLTGD